MTQCGKIRGRMFVKLNSKKRPAGFQYIPGISRPSVIRTFDLRSSSPFDPMCIRSVPSSMPAAIRKPIASRLLLRLHFIHTKEAESDIFEITSAEISPDYRMDDAGEKSIS
ncbi:hypothetical protein WA026_008179 [Henosepilachna vigintioctopunctata]|uniref:Uncharacterized protein n=1 Tax=Henosepilachna vigintioctopunctata TaxID=420089 RepID=A0AAW1TJV8_9CUCU